MKIYMKPMPSDYSDNNESGIRRVVENYVKYLPEFGIEFVDEKNAELRVGHAGALGGTADVIVAAGLYWTADMFSPSWELKENANVITSLRHAKEVIVPSSWVAENFARDLKFYPHVIGHGIDWEEWNPQWASKPFVLWNKNRKSDACDPTAVGVLAKEFPNMAFVTTFLDSEILHNITVTGALSHTDMKNLVEQCSVYLATTRETFGIGTLEAMASGKPILGFNWGGNKDLVQHGVNGYLAVPNDWEDLVTGMRYCLDHQAILGANGRDMAKGYSWLNTCKKVAGVFRLALEDNPPTVTICIPVYNYQDKVGRAIDSALAQTYPVDIIIVDDGSTDNSWAVINEYAQKHDNVRAIQQENAGVAVARNKGISLSDSKYICCLDADDAIKPTFIESLIPTLEQDRSIGIAYTGLWYILPDGKEGKSPWPGAFDANEQLKGNNQIPTCCLFRKLMWERLGGYEPRCCPDGAGFEDADFYLRATATGWDAKRATAEPLFIYSWRSGRVSSGSVKDLHNAEIDYYRTWHPWFTDGKHPFASLATPIKYSHPVRQYDEPGVSVVIPVGPGHVEMVSQALDSLEAQSYRKWEAIVVWDCAGNRSINVDTVRQIEDIQTAYPYIRTIPNTYTHKGAGYARNRGAELARAPLLLFLDADDWLYPDFLSKTLQAHTDTGDAIYTDYMGIADVDDITKLSPKLQARVRSYDGKRAIITHHTFDFDCNRVMRQPEDYPWLWCNITTLIQTAWHHDIGGFDEILPSWEDWLYWLKMARHGYCFTRIQEPLLVYRFYTGERRDWAHTGQNWQELIQYVKRKLSEGDDVGCSGCGKNRSIRPSAIPVITSTKRSLDMQDKDFRMCLYQDRNKGDHRIDSVVNDIRNYGYHTHGDRFLVHVADIQARPGNFIVEEIKLPGLAAKPAMEPIRMSDIDSQAAMNMKMEQVQAEARAVTDRLKGTFKTEEVTEQVEEVKEEPEPVPDAEPEPPPKKRRRVTRKKVIK